MVFPSRDSVLLLCCDNVETKGFLIATEMVTTRGPGVATGLALDRDFMSRQSICMSR